MANVIVFDNAKPVIRRRQEAEYRRLMNLHDALNIRGDSYYAEAERVALAAGYRGFNVYNGNPGAPHIVHELCDKGSRYMDKAQRFYDLAMELGRTLYPARRYSLTMPPKSSA